MYMAWCLTLYHNPIYWWAYSQYIIIVAYYQYHSNTAIHYCHIMCYTVNSVLNFRVDLLTYMTSHYSSTIHKCLIPIVTVVCIKLDCACIFYYRCNFRAFLRWTERM